MSRAWGNGSKKRGEMGVMERKEWGDTEEAGYKDGMEVDWGCWSQGGTCHNDKPGRVGEEMEGR